MEAKTIRVAVVDDHEMFRKGVISTIGNVFHVIGEAWSVESAINLISQTKPDVVLLDVHLPGGQGGGGSEIILKSMPLAPHTFYLALSVSDSPTDVGAVIRAGARGYVTKTINADDLIASIEQVAEGYAVFSPRLAGFVLTAFQGTDEGTVQSGQSGSFGQTGLAQQGHVGGPRSASAGSSAAGPSPSRRVQESQTSQNGQGRPSGISPAFPDQDEDDFEDISVDVLTSRERQVMQLIARGYTYKEVASELFISIKTVETHVSRVLRKLQLSNRGELALWAAHQRIV